MLKTLDEPAADAPELDLLEVRYLDLFNDASTCRPASMGGALPIPATAIRQVVRDRGWEGVEAETACWLIRQLDAEVLAHWKTEADKKK